MDLVTADANIDGLQTADKLNEVSDAVEMLAKAGNKLCVFCKFLFFGATM